MITCPRRSSSKVWKLSSQRRKIREFGEAVDAKKKDIAELTEKLEGRKADLVQKKSELEQIISETKQDEEKLREKRRSWKPLSNLVC